MITLYNGRIIVERLSLSANWRAKFRIPGIEPTIIDLCTPDVREAYIRAQYHYLALRKKQQIEKIEKIEKKKNGQTKKKKGGRRREGEKKMVE